MVAEEMSGSSDEEQAERARDWLVPQQWFVSPGAPLPDPELVLEAEAAIVFRVTGISDPVFNSADGGYWEGERGSADAMRLDVYSKVVGDVEEVWFGDWPLGEEVLLVIGDATARWEEDRTPPLKYASGGFIEGERFVLLVRRAPFPFEGGPQVWPTVYFQGNWRIDRDQTRASYGAHSASLSGLRHGLLTAFEAREAGVENRRAGPAGRPASPGGPESPDLQE